LTAAQGRKFGLTVGLAFLALGSLLLWRGKPTAATLFLGVGGTLALAGLLLPTTLGPVERAWMGLAHAISKVTTPVFMGVVYFGVMTPLGWLRRRVGGGPLAGRSAPGSRWVPHETPADRRAAMEHQF
jgi:hypothetical protein